MPVIHIHMLEGRTDEQKRALVRTITQAIVEIAKAPLEHTHVIFHEISRRDWGYGGTLLSEKE